MVQIDKGVNLQQKMDIIYAGSVVVSKAANAVQGFGTFTHNLGYKPAFLAYFLGSTGSIYYQVPYFTIGSTGSTAGLVYFKADAVADVNDIKFYIICPNITGDNSNYVQPASYRFYVYLFEQDASQS